MLAPIALALAAAHSPAPITVTRLKTFDQFRIVSIAASKGSTVAFGLEDNSVKLFNSATLQSSATLVGHPQPVYALAFNKAGTLLVTADVTARIALWDVATRKKLRDFPREKGHIKSIKDVAFSPDSTTFATVADDDSIKIWKTSGGHPVTTILGKGANLYGVGYTPSGSIVTGTLTGEMRLYTSKGAFVAAGTAPGSLGLNDLATNWSGNTVSASRDGRLTLWNVAKRQRAGSYLGHSDWAINATVSPNGLVAATSGSDGNVVIWSTKANARVATLQNQSYSGSPICFSGDGKFFLSGNASGALEVYAVSPAQGVSASSGGKRRRRR